MYFSVKGEASPCWKLVGAADRWTPNRSIKDIWTGKQFSHYRKEHAMGNFPHRCGECKTDIENDAWPLAKAYSSFSVHPEYPTAIELELSNICNLACVMCSEILSSEVRKEKGMPPLPAAYDDTFVEQLREFIPYLEELRFNGGEPFADPMVLKICNMVAEVKPELRINIATNGNVMNSHVRRILEKNNISINISIDSLDPANYPKIRRGGNLEAVLENYQIFKEYIDEKDSQICILVNPMRMNWWEMIDFVNFADENNMAKMTYNTVLYPEHTTIKDLPYEELLEIYQSMKDEIIAHPSMTLADGNPSPGMTSYLNLLNVIKGWVDEKSPEQILEIK